MSQRGGAHMIIKSDNITDSNFPHL